MGCCHLGGSLGKILWKLINSKNVLVTSCFPCAGVFLITLNMDMQCQTFVYKMFWLIGKSIYVKLSFLKFCFVLVSFILFYCISIIIYASYDMSWFVGLFCSFLAWFVNVKQGQRHNRPRKGTCPLSTPSRCYLFFCFLKSDILLFDGDWLQNCSQRLNLISFIFFSLYLSYF